MTKNSIQIYFSDLPLLCLLRRTIGFVCSFILGSSTVSTDIYFLEHIVHTHKLITTDFQDFLKNQQATEKY